MLNKFNVLLLAAGLAACGQAAEEAKPAAPVQQEAQQDPKAQIVERLKNEEYFIGENNLEKIRLHGERKDHAEKLLVLLAQADKESSGQQFGRSENI